MQTKNKRVLLGMSGGTDSSVSAMRLLEDGYEVTGVTFRFYDSPGSEEHMADAQTLAKQLGIAHFVYDARQTFEEEVVKYFVNEYLAGRTPVPCVRCNNRMKWPLLAQLADERNIHYLATGHYIRTVRVDGYYFVTHAEDADKDQTFFLWGLPQHILERMLLPMGNLTKSEARRWAAERGFHRVSTKKDSLGVCFCPTDYRPFLREWLHIRRSAQVASIRPGRFLDENGCTLGMHEGYPFYTIGQRHGLGIHLNRRIFVQSIDAVHNDIVLSDYARLEKTQMWLKEWNVVCEERLLGVSDVIVRIRYRNQENRCTVRVTTDGRLHVQLDEPLAAIAPGQAAAFYKDGLLLGGGIIERAQ